MNIFFATEVVTDKKLDTYLIVQCSHASYAVTKMHKEIEFAMGL